LHSVLRDMTCYSLKVRPKVSVRVSAIDRQEILM